MRYKANVATLNPLVIPSYKGQQHRQFTDKTLHQLMCTAVGRDILLGFRGSRLAKVDKAYIEIETHKLFIEFEADGIEELLKDKYVVPGFRVTSSRGTDFVTVRCRDFAVTDKPTDKTLTKIEEVVEDVG